MTGSSVVLLVPVALVPAESINASARPEPGLMMLVRCGAGRVRTGEVRRRSQVSMPWGVPRIRHWVDTDAPRRTWVGSIRRRR